MVKEEIEEKTIVEYLDAFGLSNQLSDQEKKQFIQIATSFQLNPFKREIYCVPYGYGENRKLSILVGYEVYLKRAERTGLLDGWRAWIDGSGEDGKAVVEIWRKDWSKPFIHEVFWKEAAQKKKDGTLTSFWKKQPKFQLKKVAISQAFRMAFPDELGGMAYDAAELPEEMTTPPERVVSPDDSSKKRKSSGKAPKLAPEKAKSNTIQFPSKKDKPADANPPKANGQEELTAAIREMLSTNGLLFPKAHQLWIEKELEKNPSKARLQEIITHMQSVIGEDLPQDYQTSMAEEPAEAEELIF
jgi:phage recombination protein Bet